MSKALDTLVRNIAKIRAGRPNPSLLDDIEADYFDTKTPIKQLANISVSDASTLTLNVWDKSAIAPIEKAIMTSDLGIMPANDGNVIRLTMPEMTEDRRKDLVKVAKGRAEDGRVSVRNARRDANTILKKMEKDKELTEDESKKFQKTIQDKTDAYISKIEDILQSKEKDIMEV